MKTKKKIEVIIKLVQSCAKRPALLLKAVVPICWILCSGCASSGGFLDTLWGSDSELKSPQNSEKSINGKNAESSDALIKYSNSPQMSVPANRQYRHMTRQRLEEESNLQAQAGSMWISEGQSGYLFAQNKTRREGDLLNVKLDAPAMRQVETKVNVIKKLLKQLEEETKSQIPKSNLTENTTPPPAGAENRMPASETPKPTENASTDSKNKKDDKTDLTEIQNIQTRIIEKLADGNYRIKGQQPFMIEKKEYKVIVAGSIRPEDFSDEGVTSSKLIDPQIDVVSIRRTIKNDYQ